ncbi:Hypp4786 [Branchiostoma lanceolatum]|uniref:Hypp4786 protein n=1 Tax=Branchiostoma lanceolatum TaxID=7740 RepID=A0A8K0AC88_BRALA|nr:Hypp4786 [Branchiostoma lanceolatum]
MSEFAVPPATCGALCQHPGCWLAHKHAHRPQPPRSLSPLTGSQQSSGGGSLPTQNVVNLLGDYGFDKRDQFNLDTGQPLADRLVAGSLSGGMSPRRQHHRPSGKNWSGYMGPHVSPMMSLRKSAEGATNRNTTTPTPIPVRPAQKVEVHEVVDFTDKTKAVNNLLGGSFLEYIWFPRPHRRRHRTTPQAGSVSKSGVVRAKDITKELLPQNLYKRKTKKKKRSSKIKSGVPTGGQPYMSSRLSPRHEGLKGISQDTLIQLLQNAQSDPNLQKLLEKMLPGLKEAIQEVARSPSPPRQQSSILNHRKMTLLDAREKSLPPMPPRTLGTAGPWRLDPLGDRATPGTGEPRHFKSPHPQTSREDVEPTSLQAQLERKYQKIYGDKRTSHPSPTQAVMNHPHMTSVTPAYTAPWEEPSPTMARPFHYKNVPFDVVMAPVQRPPAAEQDQWEDGTLESELASTIHVTMPTLSSPSPDDFFSDQVIFQERRHSRASMSSLQTSGTWPGKSFQAEDTARSNRSGAESPSHPGGTPDHSTAPTPTQLTAEPALDTIHESISQEDATSPDRKPFPPAAKPGSPTRRKPGSPIRRIPGSPTRRKPGSPLQRKPPSPIPQKQILTPPPPASSPEPWPSLDTETDMSGWSPGGAFHPGQDSVGTPPSPQVVTAMKAARAQEEESSPAPPPPSPEPAPTPTPMAHKLLPLETLEEDEEDESGPESSRKDPSEPPSADRKETIGQEPIMEIPSGTEDTLPTEKGETQETIEAAVAESSVPDESKTIAKQEDDTETAVENSGQAVPEVSDSTEPTLGGEETATVRGVPVGGENFQEQKDEEENAEAAKPVENSGSNEEDTGQRGVPEGAEEEEQGTGSRDQEKTVAPEGEGVVEGGEGEGAVEGGEGESTSVYVVEAELAKLAVADGVESNEAAT